MTADNSSSDNHTKGLDRILKYTGIFGLVQVMTIFINLMRTKLAALLIGSAGIGITQLFNRVVEWVGNSTNFGIAVSATRELSECFERGDSGAMEEMVMMVRSWSLLAALLGLAVGLVCAPFISFYTFGDYGYTTDFALLAVNVALLALGAGELAILKGVRRLKRVAMVTAVGSLGTFAIVVSVYYFFGIRGIAPSILLSTLFLFGVQASQSLMLYPWRVSFRGRILARGWHMIRFGLAYMLAGIIGSAVPVIIIYFIQQGQNSWNEVGMYGAGFMLTNYYSGIIFSAMDNDYLPRLSGVSQDREACNTIINQQMRVCLMFIAPFLVPFMLLQPVIVPLLFTEEFLPAIPMIVWGTPFVFFKAISRPLAYLMIAKGDSRMYVLMEVFFDVTFCLATVYGYQGLGLEGAGIAQSAAYLLELLVFAVVFQTYYGFRFHPLSVRLMLLQGVLLALTLAVAFLPLGGVTYGAGALLLAVSSYFSFSFLKCESTIIQRFTERLGKLFCR